jgi:phage N-6-adenine-methyltransferase
MSGEQNWRTPQDFWAVLQAEFDFEVDVAATAEDRLLDCYITPEENALSLDMPWVYEVQDRAYCNPPFKNMMPWVVKAHQEAQRHPGAVVGLLAPLSNADWYQFCCRHAHEIRHLYPRVQFEAPPGVQVSTNRGDLLFIVFRRRPANVNGAWRANEWVWRWKD